MKLIISSLIIGCLALTVNAQNEVDALRYSQLTFGGSARYTSTAGAFSALGADFSTLSVNPAGIAVYKKSEFLLSPSIYFASSQSKYNNTLGEDSKVNFNIASFGMVFTGDIANNTEAPEWKNIQFGFGVNRQANFNSSFMMRGSNPENSILDVYRQYAEGTDFDNLNPYDTQLAFDTYLLDTAGGSNHYTTAVSGGTLQQKSIYSSGGINEMVLSFGGNYNDKLYLGATLGFPFLHYAEDAYYKETDDADTLAGFESLSINDQLTTSGAGFNFKFGMIYRVADWMRIAGAVHTPTYYDMHDEYSRVVKSDLETNSYEQPSPQGVYDYKLTTPMRMIGGISFIIAKMGEISVDYEYVDYSDARLRSSDAYYDFFDQNEAINTKYTSASNIRVGTEWVFNPFSLRAGYALYGSPYKSGLNDGAKSSITAGFGIREKGYFIDFAYIYTKASEDYYLYDANTISALNMTLNPVTNTLSTHNFIITLGVKFGD